MLAKDGLGFRDFDKIPRDVIEKEPAMVNTLLMESVMELG